MITLNCTMCGKPMPPWADLKKGVCPSCCIKLASSYKAQQEEAGDKLAPFLQAQQEEAKAQAEAAKRADKNGKEQMPYGWSEEFGGDVAGALVVVPLGPEVKGGTYQLCVRVLARRQPEMGAGPMMLHEMFGRN